MATTKTDYKYRTIVTYPAMFFPDHDKLIHKAAGRLSDASGYDVGPVPRPMRDMSWYCATKVEAEKIAARVLGLKLAKTKSENTTY